MSGSPIWKNYLLLLYSWRQGGNVKKMPYCPHRARGGRDDAEAGDRKVFKEAEKERPATYPRYPGLTKVTHDIQVLIEV